MKRNIIKIISFTLLTALILWYSTLVLDYRHGQEGYNRKLRNEYDSMEKDSLDVLFVGSSATDRFWIPALAWKEMGITSINVTCNGCPTPLLPEVIEEGRRNQSPDVVVIELRRAFKPVTSFGSKRIRRLAHGFVQGKNRKAVVEKAFELTEKYVGDDDMRDKVDTSDKSYLYKYLLLHNNWKQGIKAEQFFTLYPKSTEKGYDLSSKYVWTSTYYDEPEFTSETQELGEFETECLNILLDYCDELDCEVLFLSTPFSTSQDVYEQINMAKKIVSDRGYKVLDLNSETMINDYKLDFSDDFYNNLHTNFSGAVKTTTAIMDYFEQNYDLADHRDDEKYSEEWDALYDRLVSAVKENRPEWLELL